MSSSVYYTQKEFLFTTATCGGYARYFAFLPIQSSDRHLERQQTVLIQLIVYYSPSHWLDLFLLYAAAESITVKFLRTTICYLRVIDAHSGVHILCMSPYSVVMDNFKI